VQLLIVIVAWNDQGTLKQVLDRIPEPVLRRHTCEILIVDDASVDRTFDVGRSWVDDRAEHSATVLRNPRTQGYGGNLKLAFEYAIENSFDAVVLLHADGKYAPEALPEVLSPIEEGRTDAVLGSRFLIPGSARRGDMPVHRRVVHRALTALQGRLLGARVTDFHSGYRAYTAGALRRIPFSYNSDDLHFDTEVLVQLTRGRFRVVEVPIPAYSAEDWTYRRGLRYVRGSLMSTLAAVLDSVGVKYRRQYDLRGEHAEYSGKLGYHSSHTMAIECVAPGSRVLDVGCGRGFVARELIRKGCFVVGLDQHPAEPGNVSEFVHWRLDETALPVRIADFDCLLLLDIIEHLPRPERFLEAVRRDVGNEPPTIFLSVPNIGFLPMRMMLPLGQFNYGKEGILDFTHTRLFTLGSLRDMLQQTGYEVLEVHGIPAPFPKALGMGRFSLALVRLNGALLRLHKALFAYQFFLRIRPLPTVSHLLARATRYPAERQVPRAAPVADPLESKESA
jgi:glycosyltransferase involved in cell wall biosynthesis